MKIELKAIQYSAFASEETSCYQANLYVDGKKIGTVSNAGHGGCDDFHGDRAAFESLLRAHYDLIYRMAYKWSGNKMDDEDITQNACN